MYSYSYDFTVAGVTCNSLHPGSIKTELTRHIADSVAGKAIMNGIMKIVDTLVIPLFLNAEDGALTTLYVATSPKLANVSGEYFLPTATKGNNPCFSSFSPRLLF